MRWLLALAVATALAGCSVSGDTEVARPAPSTAAAGAATPGSTPANRLPIAPRLIVSNVAFGASHRHLATAIRDLKRIGVWRRLTGHLYVVKIASRPGSHDVPEDGHLADAYLRAYIDEEGQGAMCDVLFFPAALRADLDRWRHLYASGLHSDPAPTPRQYWGAILAHELAHCLGHGRPEPTARRWEQRVLDRLRVEL